ncbi:MAG: phosphatidate cytidylyltransferase [Candidatus Sumerlaeota bacterium]|nr:phosphatidate cytidylyltransferase [Candidatus Sumerlaeota bacterium]
MAFKRNRTGFVMGGILLLAVIIPQLTWILTLFLVLTAILGISEFYTIAKNAKARPRIEMMYLMTAALILDAYFYQLADIEAILIISIAATLTVFILPYDFAGSLAGAGATLLGVLWIALPVALGLIILNMKDGNLLLGALLAIVFFTDVGAYLVGSRLGRHKLCPRLSPKKTVEGAIGGFVFALLTAFACTIVFDIIQKPQKPILTDRELLFLGAFFGIASQVGDLVESAFKRDADVKDSGCLLYGCLPLMYLFLRIFPR